MAENDGNSFVWFLAGLGLGAAIGVLYAPKSGRETRDTLREKAEESREFVVTRAREAREQADDLIERGRGMVSQQKEQLRTAIETAVDSARQAYHQATGPAGPGPTT
jgi:gas vesicle protein